jgi:hypothetical protein
MIGIDNWSNLKYRKRLLITILSNIAQPYCLLMDVPGIVPAVGAHDKKGRAVVAPFVFLFVLVNDEEYN